MLVVAYLLNFFSAVDDSRDVEVLEAIHGFLRSYKHHSDTNVFTSSITTTLAIPVQVTIPNLMLHYKGEDNNKKKRQGVFSAPE